jgi:hypothetical protein
MFMLEILYYNKEDHKSDVTLFGLQKNIIENNIIKIRKKFKNTCLYYYL